jgi:hypothetical protein
MRQPPIPVGFLGPLLLGVYLATAERSSARFRAGMECQWPGAGARPQSRPASLVCRSSITSLVLLRLSSSVAVFHDCRCGPQFIFPAHSPFETGPHSRILAATMIVHAQTWPFAENG